MTEPTKASAPIRPKQPKPFPKSGPFTWFFDKVLSPLRPNSSRTSAAGDHEFRREMIDFLDRYVSHSPKRRKAVDELRRRFLS